MTQAQAGGWRAWSVWAAGTLAFIAAMFSRTSFGVAAIPAAEQFSAPVGAMSMFVIVQAGVYAAMQIPAGAVLDRLGSRNVLAIGLGVMTAGQVVLAFATSFPLGLVARVFIGGGDALIFSSAIRLILLWFPPRKIPVLTQVTAAAGQAGQWLSAVPLVMILSNWGWTTAFLTVAASCFVGLLIAVLVVRDAPPGLVVTSRGSGGLFAGVGEVLAMPAAQLAFFIHMLAASAPIAFTFLWGFPYLTQAQGLTDAQAGSLFTVFVIASMIVGPLTGMLTRRFAARRTFLALGIVGLSAVVWTSALVWPGYAPHWLLVLLLITIGADAPASNIAFDINRSHVPAHRIGTATGVTIVGGFSAGLVVVAAIGVLLSILGGPNPSADDFRVAMSAQLVVWVYAGIMVIRKRRQLLRSLPSADE